MPDLQPYPEPWFVVIGAEKQSAPCLLVARPEMLAAIRRVGDAILPLPADTVLALPADTVLPLSADTGRPW